MKVGFRAFHEDTGEELKNVVVDHRGYAYIVRFSDGIQKAISDYYIAEGDLVGGMAGDYGEIDYSDYTPIRIEWDISNDDKNITSYINKIISKIKNIFQF